jgi:hypothetical protein
VTGSCSGSLKKVFLNIATVSHAEHEQMSGTFSQDGALASIDHNNATAGESLTGSASADFDVVARDSTVGKFARIDVHGQFGSPCTFWGMIIPSG